eukprot:1158964-Pelagomonas_calceolata.AAC.4
MHTTGSPQKLHKVIWKTKNARVETPFETTTENMLNLLEAHDAYKHDMALVKADRKLRCTYAVQEQFHLEEYTIALVMDLHF